MQVVYIVKSFGPDGGYQNLKAFANQDDAEAFRAVVAKQIPDGIEDEWVEIEGSNIVQRIEKLESMVLELLTNDRKKTNKSRTRR